MQVVDLELLVTRVKRTYYFAHISIIEATKKGSQLLVDSIHRMQKTSL